MLKRHSRLRATVLQLASWARPRHDFTSRWFALTAPPLIIVVNAMDWWTADPLPMARRIEAALDEELPLDQVEAAICGYGYLNAGMKPKSRHVSMRRLLCLYYWSFTVHVLSSSGSIQMAVERDSIEALQIEVEMRVSREFELRLYNHG